MKKDPVIYCNYLNFRGSQIHFKDWIDRGHGKKDGKERANK